MSADFSDELAVLYPEIQLAGSLREAMQNALSESGVNLTAAPHPAPGWRFSGASINNGTRSSFIHLTLRERNFALSFEVRGVLMASGSTTDLAACVVPIVLWQSGANLDQLCATAPFIAPDALGRAYEQGTAVEFIWNQFLESEHYDRVLFEAAYAQPALRVLRPYTSMNSLRFSRCTTFPFTTDLPFVVPGDEGGYRVFWQIEPSEMGSWWVDLQWPDQSFVDTASASEAIAVVLAHLPADCRPAIYGTARDLNKPGST